MCHYSDIISFLLLFFKAHLIFYYFSKNNGPSAPEINFVLLRNDRLFNLSLDIPQPPVSLRVRVYGKLGLQRSIIFHSFGAPVNWPDQFQTLIHHFGSHAFNSKGRIWILHQCQHFRVTTLGCFLLSTQGFSASLGFGEKI